MRRTMQMHQLKRLIESGDYRPQPAEVAQAMLRRRAVRELLVGTPAGADGHGRLNGAGGMALDPSGRIQSPSAVPRQAA